MQILQVASLFVITSVLAGAVAKSETTKKVEKTDVKRQIGFGLEAIHGVAAVHAPLGDETPLLALGQTGVGLIHNVPAVDSIGGFTSQGYDGYGVYAAPHALIATPLVNVHDSGWKGIQSGHGSIKHGHELAQSLGSKQSFALHDNYYQIAPVAHFTPHYTQTAPSFSSGVYATHNIQPHNYLPRGYTFTTHHAPQSYGQVHTNQHNVQHSGHPGSHHNNLYRHNNNHHSTAQNHAVHSPSNGHGSISHGHQLAKTVRFPSSHSGFSGHYNSGYNSQAKHPNLHLSSPHHSQQSPTHSYVAFKNPAPVGHNFQGPSQPSKVIPLNHNGYSNRASYSAEVNEPSEQSGYAHSDQPAGPTNDQDQYSADHKATSFQSFIIHSYPTKNNDHSTESHGQDQYPKPYTSHRQ